MSKRDPGLLIEFAAAGSPTSKLQSQPSTFQFPTCHFNPQIFNPQTPTRSCRGDVSSPCLLRIDSSALPHNIHYINYPLSMDNSIPSRSSGTESRWWGCVLCVGV